MSTLEDASISGMMSASNSSGVAPLAPISFGGTHAARAVSRGRGLGLARNWQDSTLAAQSPPVSEWRYWGGDKAFTRYSPLDQITTANVGQLKVAWRQPGFDPSLEGGLSRTARLRQLPLHAHHDQRRALRAQRGRAPARARPGDRRDAMGAEAVREHDRGDFAAEPARRRVLEEDGAERLLSRAANSCTRSTSRRRIRQGVRRQGRVNLHWDHELAALFSWTGGPIVVGDVIVVAGNGGGAGDGGVKKEAAPEDVRGFDVRTGKLLWTFHVVPRPGEFGADTWGERILKYSGRPGVVGCLTADEELGYVYVPLSAPTNACTAATGPARICSRTPRLPRRQDGQARVALPDGAPRSLGLRQRRRRRCSATSPSTAGGSRP